jgi:hypothetical protein
VRALIATGLVALVAAAAAQATSPGVSLRHFGVSCRTYNGSPAVSALNGAKGVMCKTVPVVDKSTPNTPTVHGGRYIVGLNPYFIRVIDTKTNRVVFFRSS